MNHNHSSSSTSSIAALELEHRLLNGKLLNLKRQQRSLNDEYERLSLEQANWQSSLEDTKRKLDTVLQDLQASGALAPGEISLSFHDLSDSFEGVNELIEDIALRIQYDCEDVSIGPSNVTTFATKSASSFPDISDFLEDKIISSIPANGNASNGMANGVENDTHAKANANANATVLILPLVRSILCHRLLEHIFEPFSPGIDSKKELVLSEIENSILSAEGLERAVRWRALTYPYSSMSPSEEEMKIQEYNEVIASRIFDDIQSLEQELLQTDTIRMDPNIFSAILDLVALSEIFQRGARSKCIQGDTKAFKVQPSDPIDPIKMQIVGDISDGSEEISYSTTTTTTAEPTSRRRLTVGLGLEIRAPKSTTASGKLQTTIQINWAPPAAVCIN